MTLLHMRTALILLLYGILAWGMYLPAQGQSAWPVSVHAHQFGTGQSFGQDSTYFPANVLGPITPPSSIYTPVASPQHVVSLGRGGWIALTFSPPIIDGPGADFVVFENVLQVRNSTVVFDEWLEVAVSADGETWYSFPADCETGDGMAGRTPTGSDYNVDSLRGGDAFDLSILTDAPDTIHYVRVTDATHCQTADRLAAELDGIMALNQVVWPTTRYAAQTRQAVCYVHCAQPQACRLRSTVPMQRASLYNASGQQVATLPAGSEWPLPPLPAGVYVLRAQYASGMYTQRVLMH